MLFRTNNAASKRIILSCIIFYMITKNWKTVQSLFFFLFLLSFLLLSNNTLHVMLHSYISYWNTFQYKCTLHYYFSCRKTISARVTSEDICFILILLFPCLFPFCLDFILFNEALLLWCLTGLVDPQSSCLGFTSFNVPLCLLPEMTNKLLLYWLCTILCIIFKKRLFIQALCRPLFTK